ncbi:MAG: Ig-like domain-containing protein [Erysipelotrichales bacterium]|nr:Ig-like domain-containing protein [Erysipelotrichales bacterium]
MQLFKKSFFVALISLITFILVPRNVDAFWDYTFFNINVNDNVHLVNANDQGNHIFTETTLTGGFTIVYDGSSFESSRVATPFLTLERILPDGSFETIFDGQFIRDGEVTEMVINSTGLFRMIGNTFFWGDQIEPERWMNDFVTFEILEEAIFTGWRVTYDRVDYYFYDQGVKSDGEWVEANFFGNNSFFDVTFLGNSSGNQSAEILLMSAHQQPTTGNGGVSLVLNRFFQLDETFRVNFVGEIVHGTILFTITQRTRIALMVDPSMHAVGTEVTLNGGARYSTQMTVGFTRIIYIGWHGYAQSRHNFTLTSSDENIATVSEHGLIFARAPGRVDILAIRNDNLQFGVVAITVSEVRPGPTRNLALTTDTRQDPSHNGTEVTSGVGLPRETTMNVGLTRSISFDGVVPSPIIQNYLWTTSDPRVATVSQFGTVTAHNPGIVTIDVVYRYNMNFRGSITLQVLSPWVLSTSVLGTIFSTRLEADTDLFALQADGFFIRYEGFDGGRRFSLFFQTLQSEHTPHIFDEFVRPGERIYVHGVGGYLNFRSEDINVTFDLQRSIWVRLTTNAELGKNAFASNRGRELWFAVHNDYPRHFVSGVLLQWTDSIDSPPLQSGINTLTINMPFSPITGYMIYARDIRSGVTELISLLH